MASLIMIMILVPWHWQFTGNFRSDRDSHTGAAGDSPSDHAAAQTPGPAAACPQGRLTEAAVTPAAMMSPLPSLSVALPESPPPRSPSNFECVAPIRREAAGESQSAASDPGSPCAQAQ